MHTNCVKCLILQANKLLEKHRIHDDDARDIIVRFRLFIDEHKNNNLTAPEAACLLHRMVKKVTNTNDLYAKEKKDYNNLMLSFEENTRDIIFRSENPFRTALRYALAGNIIDFGPPEPFDVFKALSEAAHLQPAIDHSALLLDELKKASTVLYLGDNAGEIVLDKLFIETINHPNLWFAVRGGNVLNDITLVDAKKVGIDKLAHIISNGYDAPSTILDRCSAEFRSKFEEADIIISKGQGNLEGLIGNTDKKIFFLLMVKCNVIAEMIGVKEKSTVAFLNQKVVSMAENHSLDFNRYTVLMN
ncbi:MAG: ARMT1-like domain-containing protein [Bacteroidales bacterium]